MEAKKKAAKPEPAEIPQLAPEYPKARRQLVLWSALLIAYELIGIDMQELAKAGGNAGAIAKSLRNPEAIPWVLLALVVYFFYRVWVEWENSPIARRKERGARIDRGVTWAISFAALGLYAFQRMAEVRAATLIAENPSRTVSLLVGTAAGMTASMVAVAWWKPSFRKQTVLAVFAYIVLFSGALALRGIEWPIFGFGLLIGILLFLLALFIGILRESRKDENKHSTRS